MFSARLSSDLAEKQPHKKQIWTKLFMKIRSEQCCPERTGHDMQLPCFGVLHLTVSFFYTIFCGKSCRHAVLTSVTYVVRCQMESKLPPGYTLRMAASHADFRSFAGLAVHYHQWLDVDLCFQDFEHELASLPGSYAQPAGCILLVSHSSCPGSASEDVACVAVRPLKGQARPEETNTCNSSAAAAAPLPSTPHQHQQHNAAHRLETSPTCELKRLWVEEPHQRFGLGRVLMAAALQASAAGHMQASP